MAGLTDAGVIDEVAVFAHGALVVVNVVALDAVGEVGAGSADGSGASRRVDVVEGISAVSAGFSQVAGEVSSAASPGQV